MRDCSKSCFHLEVLTVVIAEKQTPAGTFGLLPYPLPQVLLWSSLSTGGIVPCSWQGQDLQRREGPGLSGVPAGEHHSVARVLMGSESLSVESGCEANVLFVFC